MKKNLMLLLALTFAQSVDYKSIGFIMDYSIGYFRQNLLPRSFSIRSIASTLAGKNLMETKSIFIDEHTNIANGKLCVKGRTIKFCHNPFLRNPK